MGGIKKVITITDVAKAAGVSTAAVCNALAGKGRMREETRSRIKEIAKEMNYHPNRAASALARRTIVIGVILPAFPSVIQSQLYRGITDRFNEYKEQNFEYRICYFHQHTSHDELNIFLYENINDLDGIIIECGDEFDDPKLSEYVEIINQMNIPVVSLITSTDNIKNSAVVTFNAEISGKIAAQYFQIMNRKRAVVFTGYQNAPIHKKNTNGFLNNLSDKQITCVGIYENYDDLENAHHLTKKVILQDPEIDAIFLTNYAAPSVCRCLSELGVAGQISVVGVDIFDDTADCIKDGSLDMAIYQNQYQSAVTAVDTMVGFFTYDANRNVTEKLIKPEIVIKSNLDCYIQ